MTALSPTSEHRASDRFVTHESRSSISSSRDPKRAFNDPDSRMAKRIESALDRLLRDIERLEEAERWDGMS